MESEVQAVEINEVLARKVLEVVDVGLVHGMGIPVPGQMCIEAAVNYAMGLPHGDEPACVAPALRRLKIRLNDSRWSSNTARAKGLRRLGLAQLGSAGVLDEVEFAKRCARLAIQTCVPQALRAAASLFKDGAKKERLLAAADLCERSPTEANARSAKDAAGAAYAAAYAADAADAAAAAAYAAAYAADAADAAAAYAADRSLAAFAEGVVQILVEMKAPGCQWLYLTEGGEADTSLRGVSATPDEWTEELDGDGVQS
jgi:hypothetical protein